MTNGVSLRTVQRRLSTKKYAQDAVDNLLSNPALRKDHLAEFVARGYATECMEGIMNIARNDEVDPDVRRKAYESILHYGYGKPASVLRIPGEGQQNPVIDGEIEEASKAAQALGYLVDNMATPPDEWDVIDKEKD